MIHAYSKDYLLISQELMGNLFELAVCHANIEINDFVKKFLESKVCSELEIGNPIYLLGKSAAELLAIILDSTPINDEHNQAASPEYWLGYTLAYAQWYLNKPYEYILKYNPCDELILSYFPYHEMDIMHSVQMISDNLPKVNLLKELRNKKGLSQNDLALLSDIPIRTIKSYEQGTVELSKAQGETLYALSKVLGCNIEELIK